MGGAGRLRGGAGQGVTNLLNGVSSALDIQHHPLLLANKGIHLTYHDGNLVVVTVLYAVGQVGGVPLLSVQVLEGVDGGLDGLDDQTAEGQHQEDRHDADHDGGENNGNTYNTQVDFPHVVEALHNGNHHVFRNIRILEPCVHSQIVNTIHQGVSNVDFVLLVHGV